MTTINNFDMSSTGVNLSFNGFYDIDLAQIQFNENVERLRFGYYFHGGSLTTENIQDLLIANLDDTLELLKRESSSPTCVIDWLNFFGCEGESVEECIENYTNITIESLDIHFDLSKSDIQSLLPEGFEVYETRGYGQGDYALVIYKSFEGFNPRVIDNIFWDAPIQATLEVNGEKVYLLENYYGLWSKEVALKSFERAYEGENKIYIRRWLESNLPEHLNCI